MRPITIKFSGNQPKNTMTTQQINQAVCSVFPVTEDEIMGPGRTRRVSEARHVCITLAHKFLRMSNMEACGAYNRLTHGYCVHVRRRYAALYETDNAFRAMVDKVLSQLQCN
jgi:chromosomal replication initiation ATPase DnaA